MNFGNKWFGQSAFEWPRPNIGISANLFSQPDEKFYYTIVAPKSFRPNSDYTVKLTLLNGSIEWENREPIVVSVTIEDESDETLFRVERTATLQLNVTECITIPIGGNVSVDASYSLIVKAISGASFKHEASLDVQTKKVAILIQTDKGIYKPSDTVKFRVFVLNENLRPAAIDENQLKIHVTVSKVKRVSGARDKFYDILIRIRAKTVSSNGME